MTGQRQSQQRQARGLTHGSSPREERISLTSNTGRDAALRQTAFGREEEEDASRWNCRGDLCRKPTAGQKAPHSEARRRRCIFAKASPSYTVLELFLHFPETTEMSVTCRGPFHDLEVFGLAHCQHLTSSDARKVSVPQATSHSKGSGRRELVHCTAGRGEPQRFGAGDCRMFPNTSQIQTITGQKEKKKGSHHLLCRLSFAGLPCNPSQVTATR